MSVKGTASPILQLIRRAVVDPQVRERPDRDLLQQFLSQHDEAAFHTLLRRHGSMVLDVCRGVLGDGPDAEDAFQATFLILAQKGGSIRKGAALGSWLHGVAHRTALKARTRSAVRQKYEARGPRRQASDTDDLSWREVRQVLHEELGAIPERYREALVMCYLEGATQQRAAARLGLAERTLRERLERGRELLRERLVRRGLGPAAVLVVASWPTAPLSAAVPTVLVDSTVKAATNVAAGDAASVVSARVATLTQEVGKSMFLSQSKVTVAGLLVAALFVGGALVPSPDSLLPRSLAQQPGAKQPGRVPDMGAARETPDDKPVGKETSAPTWQIGPALQQHGDRLWEVAFSPDGKWLASSSNDKSVMVWDTVRGKTAHTLTHDGTPISVVFTPDNKTLITASGGPNDDHLIQFWDVATGKEQTALKNLPNIVHDLSLSPDGKLLVACIGSLSSVVKSGEIVFWDLKTQKKVAAIECETMASRVVLSHDGKKMVTSHSDGTVARHVNDKFEATRQQVLAEKVVTTLCVSPDRKAFIIVPAFVDSPSIDLWDFETEKVTQSFVHKGVFVRDVAFSPDGKTLAAGCCKKVEKGNNKELAGEVKFWDVATGQEKQTLSDKLGPVNAVAFNRDGKTLAVGLHNKENIKLGEKGSYEEPAGGYAGAVILCELKAAKR